MELRHKGLLYIFISLVAAATITIITKIAILHGGNPTKILLLRFVIVVVFLFGYMQAKNISWRTSRKNFFGLIGLGFAYVNVSLLFFLSMKYISPSLGGVILYTYPMLVSILSALILKERFTMPKTMALFF
ncbi:EamA family transporter [uncultured Desulfuromusa sp.]|uniref:EamA family transporter n=1 Tax=uncultured Desulfuromusa sp. TaxID=219183 RepID=UPI002AA83CF4|nr:EamA family transporter [uncultured Desulfuromusa sp.]